MCGKETHEIYDSPSKYHVCKITGRCQTEESEETMSELCDEILSIFNNFDWLLWFSMFHDSCIAVDMPRMDLASAVCNISAFYVSNHNGWSLPMMTMTFTMMIVFQLHAVGYYFYLTEKRCKHILDGDRIPPRDAFVCVNVAAFRSAFGAILFSCRLLNSQSWGGAYRSVSRFGLLIQQVIVFSHTNSLFVAMYVVSSKSEDP